MEDDMLLDGMVSFITDQDARQYPLTLEEVDSQQLLADTDAFLQALNDKELTYKIKETTDQTLTKQQLAKFKAGQRRDAYRQRLKTEKATLKQEDAELSCLLTKLQKIKTKKPVKKSLPGDTLGLMAWKAVATRQYESRLEAEVLRKKLQTTVNNQAVMIQDLGRVLKKRVREVKNTVEGVPGALEKKTRFGAKETMLYNTYFDSLETLYARLEEVFNEVGMTPTPGDMLAGEPIRKFNGGTEYFETIGVGTIPFSFQATCGGVWELMSLPHRVIGRRVYDGLPDPENSMALQVCSPIHRENGDVFNLWLYLVVRRYIEKARVVIVWRVLYEPDGDFPGFNSDETGWCIIHAHSSDLDPPTGAMTTLVQACIRMTPMHFQDGNAKKEETMEQFMKVVVETGQEDNREIEHMLERLKLDEALATDDIELDEDGNLIPRTI